MVTLAGERSGQVRAKMLVNAAGPWGAKGLAVTDTPSQRLPQKVQPYGQPLNGALMIVRAVMQACGVIPKDSQREGAFYGPSENSSI